MSFREELIILRTDKKLTQEELAERLGVSRQAVTKWEAGASVPELSRLLVIADYFGVSMDKLCGRGDTMYDVVKEAIEKRMEDYKTDEDFSLIVHRFINYMETLGMSAEKTLNGICYLAKGEDAELLYPECNAKSADEQK